MVCWWHDDGRCVEMTLLLVVEKECCGGYAGPSNAPWERETCGKKLPHQSQPDPRIHNRKDGTEQSQKQMQDDVSATRSDA